jgi:hypothetical protein
VADQIPEKSPVTYRDAVNTAFSRAEELLPGIGDMLLEEIELSDDDNYRLVTLSGTQTRRGNDKPETSIMAAFPWTKRVYKVFKIDRKSGDVRSMKIRELQYAR